jgi:hypothetical protein
MRVAVSYLLEVWIPSVVAVLIFFLTVILSIPTLNVLFSEEIRFMASASLIVCSIIFGFLSASFMHISAHVGDCTKNLSDLAKELLDAYDRIIRDEKLRQRTIKWKTRIYDYGFNGFEESTNAPEAIRSVYDYLQNVRYMLFTIRKFIHSMFLLFLAFLFSSLVLATRAYFPVDWQRESLALSLGMTLAGAFLMCYVWWFSSKRLGKIEDTLFNIRQQILGQLRGFDTYIEDAPTMG